MFLHADLFARGPSDFECANFRVCGTRVESYVYSFRTNYQYGRAQSINGWLAMPFGKRVLLGTCHAPRPLSFHAPRARLRLKL